MESPRLTALAAGAAAVWLAAACAPEPEVVDRVLTVHTPAACAVPGQGYALFYAFGDFQPSPSSPAYEGRFLRDLGVPLELLPRTSRAFVVDIAAGALTFRGATLVPERGAADILAWPASRECPLTGSVGDAARRDARLTVSDHYAVLSGGTEPGRVPETFVADLSTGHVERVGTDLVVARERAAAAAYRGGVLVTGGARPGDGTLGDTAERLVLGDGVKAFDGAPIPLSTARAEHAAVTLVTGEVLLVGGRGPTGNVLGSLEIVDPIAGRARTPGLASLAKPRRGADAVRLANGEILVWGGFDAAGARVATFEWLTADATRAARAPRDGDVGAQASVVPLAAGGALSVVLRGSMVEAASVLVLTEDGDLEPAPSLTGDVKRIALFASAGGAPLLFTGSRWLRWQPWEGTFAPLGEGAAGPAEGAPTALGDPGLALWTDGGRLVGYRVDVRGPYATEVRPMLRDQPLPLVPNHLVASGTLSPIRFDTGTGLTLADGTAAFVPDAIYGDFVATIEVAGDAAPVLVLRDDRGADLELGGALCPAPTTKRFSFTRRGATAQVANADGVTARCDLVALGSRRVSLGLRARGTAGAVVRELTVERR